jgi:GTPase
MLGPDVDGNFKSFVVSGIQKNCIDIESAGPKETVCICIKSDMEFSSKKGINLVNPVSNDSSNPYHSLVCRYFDAKIRTLPN